jgi:hypothetical protein
MSVFTNVFTAEDVDYLNANKWRGKSLPPFENSAA